MVAELIADLSGDIRPIDRILVEQAAWLLIQGEDHQRARNSGKPVSDEDMTRCANGAARILLKLRGNVRKNRGEPGVLGELLRAGHSHG